jgi:hypothetical protein
MLVIQILYLFSNLKGLVSLNPIKNIGIKKNNYMKD